jgi:hypothetical protein
MSALTERLDLASPQGVEDLGGAWDQGVLEACRQLAAMDETAKEAIRAEMTTDRSWSLLGWAQRMATLTVRTGDPELAATALAGLSLFDRRDFDGREALVVRALLLRAVSLTGADPSLAVGAAAAGTDALGRDWLRGLGDGYPAPDQMGFVERGSGPSFRFDPVGEEWDPELELGDFADEDAQEGEPS